MVDIVFVEFILFKEKFDWGVKMKGFDIEVVLNIDNNQAYCGIGLTKQSLFRRNITHFGPTTLRATICASLLQFSDISLKLVSVQFFQ